MKLFTSNVKTIGNSALRKYLSQYFFRALHSKSVEGKRKFSQFLSEISTLYKATTGTKCALGRLGIPKTEAQI